MKCKELLLKEAIFSSFEALERAQRALQRGPHGRLPALLPETVPPWWRATATAEDAALRGDSSRFPCSSCCITIILHDCRRLFSKYLTYRVDCGGYGEESLLFQSAGSSDEAPQSITEEELYASLREALEEERGEVQVTRQLLALKRRQVLLAGQQRRQVYEGLRRCAKALRPFES